MSLVNELIKGLLPEEEKKKVVAVYGGGFKPPTSGHFEVVKQALKENPEIDEFIILIGGKPRNGITPDESILIWDIYKTYLPFKVEVKYTSVPPIKGIYNYAKEHPDEEVLFIIGAREGNEDDFKDIASRTTSLDKYPNLNLRTIVTQGGVSGTAARNASKISLEKFKPFVPSELSDEEVEQVYNIVADKIQENYVLQDLENQYGIDLDLYDNGKHLTLSRISIPKDKRGQGIGSKVINQITQYADKENKPIYLTPTKDFGASSVSRLEQFYKQFGFKKKNRSDFSTKETMVRMPLNESVDFVSLEKTLDDMFEDLGIDINFTRHFKERVIERGLTEEDIIELMEKIYDTYGDEVADLSKDENRVFTHLKRLIDIAAINKGYGEDYLKDLVLKTAYKRNSPREPEFKTNRTSPKLKVTENASYGQHINIIEKIAELTNYMIESGMNIEPLPTMEFIDGDSENAKDFFGKTAYYDPNRQHIVLYTEGRHPKDIVRSYAHEMIHHIQNLEDRLGDISTTNTQEDDNLNDIEAEANLKGTMTFRNWTDSLQEGKKKDPFGLLAYARELGQLNEEESEYKVYLDMDGVLADFDQRFRDLSGMEPKEFENKYGKKAFWNLIDEENKIKFWVGIPTMPGAADLVDAVKDYNYELLTSPSAKKQSYLGKILWVKNHTGDVFPSKPRINFKKAKEKHLIKPQLSKTDILIDDREDTIERWNIAGGTGIIYKSIGQVLNDLKKLGL